MTKEIPNNYEDSRGYSAYTRYIVYISHGIYISFSLLAA